MSESTVKSICRPDRLSLGEIMNYYCVCVLDGESSRNEVCYAVYRA